MKDKPFLQDRLKNRFVLIALGYMLAFIFILLQLVNLQLVNGQNYERLSQQRLLRNSSISAPRGNILDRNNIPIAVNKMGYSVLVSKTSITSDKLNEMIYQLILIFEKNNESYVNTLSKYLTIDTTAQPDKADLSLKYGAYIIQSDRAIENWKKQIVNNAKDINNIKTAKDVFDYFLITKFKIDAKYSPKDAYKIMAIRYEMFISGYTAVNPIFLSRNVSNNTVAEIEERYFEFPGVFNEVVPMRKYIDAIEEAHIIGYIGKVSDSEYVKKKELGYGLNDMLGKTGIESRAEELLRGVDGLKQIEIDKNGKLTTEIAGRAPILGNDVVLTIDTKLQKVAYDSLEKNINLIKSRADGKNNFGDAYAGAAVAIDVATGEILTMVSYPSYDPSVFLASTDDYEAQRKKVEYLTDNKNAPMFNRVIKGAYAPGSTFKPLTAIAALEEGIIKPSDTIYDSGTYYVDSKPFYCLEWRMGLGAHGNINLKRALATSCNIYFHEVGLKTSIDNISKWCKIFGLGTFTGIDLPGEVEGNIGDREFKNRALKEAWYPADTAQTAIGQLYTSFTPIQMVDYISAIANGEQKMKPYIIKKVMKSDGSLVSQTKPEGTKVPIKLETLQAVKEGMIAVTNAVDGTAVSSFVDFPFQVAGKTGTPETGFESRRQSSNSVFICYAPADKPKIAIAVVIERGVWGANSAPVARDILKEYFGLNKTISLDEKAQSDIVILTK